MGYFPLMTSGSSGDLPVDQALAGGAPPRVGWYRFYFADERWEWSPEVELIHGYAPGTANPTTELVLSHKHPGDYEHVAAMLDEIRDTRLPFSTRHRIVTVEGATREVVVIGESFPDSTGEAAGTQGFYIDVTPVGPSQQAAIDEAVAEFAENRAVIEQVKGVLMFVYHIDADTAFGLLKWRSQETNVKLRTLAEQLQEDINTIGRHENLTYRATFDRFLLTSHQRVRAKTSREDH
jgi:hypothetical protein